MSDYTVRTLLLDELPACAEMGARFYQEFLASNGTFVPSVFLANMTSFYNLGIGAVMGVWRHAVMIGAVGVLLSPDLFDGRSCATELFWYVDREHRGGRGGILLIHAFEDWARARGAVEVRLTRLEANDHAGGFDRAYRRWGYAPLEHGYWKSLTPI